MGPVKKFGYLNGIMQYQTIPQNICQVTSYVDAAIDKTVTVSWRSKKAMKAILNHSYTHDIKIQYIAWSIRLVSSKEKLE